MNLSNLHPQTRMVVFDDDPTGIQTVHSCLLVTDWTDENIRMAMQDEVPFFYILTNTRALTANETRKTLTSALEAVIRVNQTFGYRLICVSRSDSCLRGHFPLEPYLMREVLHAHGYKIWPKIPFAPALIESGRITIDGTHYMRDGEKLIPVSESEFARDNVFGYKNANLLDYIREKGGDPEDFEIVNAQTYDELNTFCETLFSAIEGEECSVVVRSSSSLPRALSGIGDKPFLKKEDLGIRSNGTGIFVVGSHVRKTTEQLNELLKADQVHGIELPIEDILNEPAELMAKTQEDIKKLSMHGITPIVYTARQEVRIEDAAKRLHLGQVVSDFLVDIVRSLTIRPSYVVAKGGITSHDILTKGLSVKTARVMGQVINSVPCVMTERFPYIIFPGNVGGPRSLREIYEGLRG
ncbi:MAG: hypothetical protein IKX59_09605 [Bacteroidales bacterium]|nr:hypothetical protein [Bacteroidales bacterium]